MAAVAASELPALGVDTPVLESTVRAARATRPRAAGHLSSSTISQVCESCETGAEEETTYEALACCNICAEGDWEDDNQIIFCDSCDLAVHQVRRQAPGSVAGLLLARSSRLHWP